MIFWISEMIKAFFKPLNQTFSVWRCSYDFLKCWKETKTSSYFFIHFNIALYLVLWWFYYQTYIGHILEISKLERFWFWCLRSDITILELILEFEIKTELNDSYTNETNYKIILHKYQMKINTNCTHRNLK